MANISALEKSILSDRVKAGIKAAKDAGNKYSGRVKGSVESNDEVLMKYKKVVKEIKANPTLSLRKISALTGIEPNTVKKVKEIIDKEKG